MLLKRLLIYLFLATASLGSPFLLHAQKEPQVVKSKELEGTVEVSFKIDGAGKVEILNINATSPQLADYVIKKLKKIVKQCYFSSAENCVIQGCRSCPEPPFLAGAGAVFLVWLLLRLLLLLLLTGL